jgi:ABC-type multidrug transport system ATPase subunit
MDVIVGPNNAGKSTVLDGLRVASSFLTYAGRRKPIIKSQGNYGACATYLISEPMLAIPLSNTVRNYAEEDAIIELKNDQQNVLRIHLHPHRQPEAFIIPKGRRPATTQAFKKTFPETIAIVPTLSPFEEREPLISEDRVRMVKTTRLASRNFRNVWLNESNDNFNVLSDAISAVWPKIRLSKPARYRIEGKSFVEMLYREGASSRELYWAGFGFQVWLQTISQAIISSKLSVIVLDEPDIYLHPDLQKRLVDFLQTKFKQVIIATHSTEIINHLPPKSVKIIDSERNRAERIVGDKSYRRLFEYLGASENVEFARLNRAKRVVFFEGNDKRLLRKIDSKISNKSILSNPDIIFLKSGGYGGKDKVANTGWVLEQALGLEVKVFSLFDKDYRSIEENNELEKTLSNSNVICKVLNRKEIENYCLRLSTIQRLVIKKAKERNLDLDESYVAKLVDQVSSTFKSNVFAQTQSEMYRYQISAHIKTDKPRPDTTKIHAKVFDEFEKSWSDFDARAKILPGKEFLAKLAHILSDKFGINISFAKLMDEMHYDELDTEIISTLEALNNHFK